MKCIKLLMIAILGCSITLRQVQGVHHLVDAAKTPAADEEAAKKEAAAAAQKALEDELRKVQQQEAAIANAAANAQQALPPQKPALPAGAIPGGPVVDAGDDDAAKKKADEEAEKELEAKQLAEKEAARKSAEAAAKRADDAEARRKADEEAAKKKADDEKLALTIRALKAIEAEKKRAADEAAAKNAARRAAELIEKTNNFKEELSPYHLGYTHPRFNTGGLNNAPMLKFELMQHYRKILNAMTSDHERKQAIISYTNEDNDLLAEIRFLMSDLAGKESQGQILALKPRNVSANWSLIGSTKSQLGHGANSQPINMDKVIAQLVEFHNYMCLLKERINDNKHTNGMPTIDFDKPIREKAEQLEEQARKAREEKEEADRLWKAAEPERIRQAEESARRREEERKRQIAEEAAREEALRLKHQEEDRRFAENLKAYRLERERKEKEEADRIAAEKKRKEEEAEATRRAAQRARQIKAEFSVPRANQAGPAAGDNDAGQADRQPLPDPQADNQEDAPQNFVEKYKTPLKYAGGAAVGIAGILALKKLMNYMHQRKGKARLEDLHAAYVTGMMSKETYLEKRKKIIEKYGLEEESASSESDAKPVKTRLGYQ